MSVSLPVDAPPGALSRRLTILQVNFRASQARYGADARQNAGS
jgi:hypothetical protein